MDHCEVHKAFNSLWSITDEIFKHVADIRAIINEDKGPEGEALPSDSPSNKTSMPKEIGKRLSQKFTCLENLNRKRKVLLEEFSTALKSDDLDEKKQIREESGEDAPVISRDDALKNLASYTRARHSALIKLLDQLEYTRKTLNEFRRNIGAKNTAKEDLNGRHPEYATLDCWSFIFRSEGFLSQVTDDRVTLLREGKMAEETILKVPHETDEKTSKILKDVRDSYLQIKEAQLLSFASLIEPILHDFVEFQTGAVVENAVYLVAVNLQSLFNEYTLKVQKYNQALQSLADHLII